ncbi:UNVERIFIED_CONTAM: IS3 family transposase [Streptococcus canis]
MKSEMFYGFKKAFASLKVLETAISEDINYYHHNRIKLTLKGLRPVILSLNIISNFLEGTT